MRFSDEVLTAIRKACGEDFVIGMAVSIDPARPDVQSVESLQEIVAWLDKHQLCDYVTCGTGSYFDFTKIIPPAIYEDKLGAPYAVALKQVAKNLRVQAESHIRTPDNANYILTFRRRRHDLDRARPDRRSALGQQGEGRARDGHPPVPVLQPDVLGPALARLSHLLPDQSQRRPRIPVGRRPLHAERPAQARAGGGRRPGRARSGAGGGRARAIASRWRRPRTSWADSSASPGCSRAARRSPISWTGWKASCSVCRSRSGATPISTPTRSRPWTMTR